MYFYDTSLNSSENEKYLRQNLKIKTKHILCSVKFFSKNCAVYEIMWKNIVQPDDKLVPRVTSPYWITKATSHIHTQTRHV